MKVSILLGFLVSSLLKYEIMCSLISENHQNFVNNFVEEPPSSSIEPQTSRDNIGSASKEGGSKLSSSSVSPLSGTQPTYTKVEKLDDTTSDVADFRIETSPWKSHLTLLYQTFISLTSFDELPPFTLTAQRSGLAALFFRKLVQSVDETRDLYQSHLKHTLIDISGASRDEEKQKGDEDSTKRSSVHPITSSSTLTKIDKNEDEDGEEKDKELDSIRNQSMTITRGRKNHYFHPEEDGYFHPDDVKFIKLFENLYPMLVSRVPITFLNWVDSSLLELRRNHHDTFTQAAQPKLGPLIGINSAFGFEAPRNLLLHTLLKVAKVPGDRIFVFIGGCNNESYAVSKEDGVKTFYVKHNSIDFTALITIYSTHYLTQFDWFILHDTCEVGPKFWHVLLQKYNVLIELSSRYERKTTALKKVHDDIESLKSGYNNENVDIESSSTKPINIVDDILERETAPVKQEPISNSNPKNNLVYGENRFENMIMPLTPEGSMNMGFYRSLVFQSPEFLLFLGLMRNDNFRHVDIHDEEIEKNNNSSCHFKKQDEKEGEDRKEKDYHEQETDLELEETSLISQKTMSELPPSGALPSSLTRKEVVHDQAAVGSFKHLGVRVEEGAFRLLQSSTSSLLGEKEGSSSGGSTNDVRELVRFCTLQHPKAYLTPVKVYGGSLRKKIVYEDLDLIKYKANVDFKSNQLFLDP